MNIKIISQYYSPDNFKINEIAPVLAEKGHQVSVLTGLPDYTTSKIPREYKLLKKRKEKINGVKVRRVGTIARRRSVFFRILNYLSFAIIASFYALFSSKKNIDSIFVYQLTPIFQVIPGIIYQWRTKKKLVVYCLDLWPESMKAWNIKESSVAFKMVKKISSWCYRKADIVAVSSLPFKDYLINVCKVDGKKVRYLPQHANDDYSDNVGKYEENSCIDFLFAGNLGAVQDVDVILRAVVEINTVKKFHVHIAGDGSEQDNLKDLAEKLNINDRVTFHGRFPQNEMHRFYKMADCFLLTLRGGDFIGKTLPGKVQGYTSVGKPIVGAIDGAGNDLINEADCGETVSAGDYIGLAKKMEAVINNFDYYKEKGTNGRKYYEEHFTIDKFSYKLENILNEGVNYV